MGHQLLINVIVLFVLMATYLQCSLGRLLVLSDCVCPGHTLRLECTVVGAGFTIWRGTVFECPSRDNEIFLRHSQFESRTALGLCNDGRIIGRGVRKISDSDDIKYSSQLIIHLDVNATIDGESVKCLHNNLTQEILIGTHTIAYTRDPPPPPEDVHLSEADRNRLDFTWDPVRRACPFVEYKVTAVNCGVCPTATHNTSITCAVDIATVIDNLCILSIQSVVCGVTGENRSNVTATLKVPGTPVLKRILPYYNSTSRQLKKIEVQVMTHFSDVFSISEGIDGSVRTYTFHLTYSNSVCGHISKPIQFSSCESEICSYTLENLTSLSCFDDSSQVIVKVFASNILGNGLSSNASYNIDIVNKLFYAQFELFKNSFSCHFIQSSFENKSCLIKYGITDVFKQSCNIKNEIRNSSDNTLVDTVSVLLPTLSRTESEFCFIAIGETDNFTIAVEGTFNVLGHSFNKLQLIISVCCVIILFVVLVILIPIGVIGGILRKQSLRQKSEENTYQAESSVMQQEKRQKAVSGAENLIYSEVKIFKSAENKGHIVTVTDNDKVVYAEINHHANANRHVATNKYDEVYDMTHREEAADNLLTLDSLLFQLRSQVTSEWHKFGLALEITEEVLNKYLDYPSEECIVEVLEYWLRNHGRKPTWKEVAKALRDIGLNQLSDHILTVYTSGVRAE